LVVLVHFNNQKRVDHDHDNYESDVFDDGDHNVQGLSFNTTAELIEDYREATRADSLVQGRVIDLADHFIDTSDSGIQSASQCRNDEHNGYNKERRKIVIQKLGKMVIKQKGLEKR
jgi:hypothetical protein